MHPFQPDKAVTSEKHRVNETSLSKEEPWGGGPKNPVQIGGLTRIEPDQKPKEKKSIRTVVKKGL